jgi:UDP-N-acetylmuramoyl-tripeptide--D-alanyl-D-alanine ligase
MMRTLAAAANATRGRLAAEHAGSGDIAFAAVSTDSRTLPAGALFVALRGPAFDGHEFVAAAAAAGAVGAIVDRVMPVPLPQIVTADTLRALQALSLAWRVNFDFPLVAVAGSNGKTTCKGMTAAILSRTGPCIATQGNLNNHIGVPLTLLRLEATLRSAVVEMGANRIGDVADLMRLVRPTVGLITNAGAEHLEFFGDLDGVARGEGETVAHLRADATAVINADDACAGYWRGIASARRVITFGLNPGADFRAENPLQGIEAGEFVTRFTLVSPLGDALVTVRTGGLHNVANAVAAAAGASAAGASLEDVIRGLADFRAVSGRLQLKSGSRDSWIIDDSYNANPNSVRAGLDVLRSMSGRKWLVLGDMGELGAHTEASHDEIGAYARACGVERLFALGALTPLAVQAFGSGAEWFADADALAHRVEADLAPGVTVLIKGSRVNRLERVVRALTGGAGGGAGYPMPMAS